MPHTLQIYLSHKEPHTQKLMLKGQRSRSQDQLIAVHLWVASQLKNKMTHEVQLGTQAAWSKSKSQ